MKKILFLTENNFNGYVNRNFTNMRTEFAWISALQAYHSNIEDLSVDFNNFDCIFVIWPKEFKKSLNLKNVIFHDKFKRKYLIYSIQEGPHNYLEDYDINLMYNLLSVFIDSDYILCHNEYDIPYYKAITNKDNVYIIPTLMIEDNINNITSKKEEKIVVGGNFCSWYGGLKSWLSVRNTNLPIYSFKSGRAKTGEDSFVNLLEWCDWLNYMKILSTFKYAVNLMPTIAAGTFSLNCAYFGIPCIGNKKIDTQRKCFPDLSIDVEDVELAEKLIYRLINDKIFYNYCSSKAKQNYNFYFSENRFISYMRTILEK